MQAILILDDSATMLMSVSRTLRKAGYEVDTATNGKEGMDKLAGGMRPSAILTDLNMPQMDGIAFIREARRSPSTRFTPILVLTTESSGNKRDEARSAGASGWLTKPTEPDELLSTLKRLLPAK